MISMGIDASTTCTGFSIFDGTTLISYGAIPCDDELENWRDKVGFMTKELFILMKRYKVEQAFVEVPIRTMKNVNTLEVLFCLHGAIMGLCKIIGVECVPVEVSEWRKKLGMLKDIKKGEDKKAILKERSVKMANELYGLNLIWKSPHSKFNSHDTGDAILIAHSMLHPKLDKGKAFEKKEKKGKN